MDRGRLEAFSDGVFAVAITLLALNLAVAGTGHGPLLHQLGEHWPSFIAYLISFFTIGIIWVNHHALVRSIAVVDRTLLFLNLLLLLFVVVIPFATATLAIIGLVAVYYVFERTPAVGCWVGVGVGDRVAEGEGDGVGDGAGVGGRAIKKGPTRTVSVHVPLVPWVRMMKYHLPGPSQGIARPFRWWKRMSLLGRVIIAVIASVALVGIALGLALAGGAGQPPTQDPSDVHSLSHQIGQLYPHTENRIVMAWTPPAGARAYSVLWSQARDEAPDARPQLPGDRATATSPALGPGKWYFIMRTQGASGTWTDTVRVGPFLIALPPTPAPSPTPSPSPSATPSPSPSATPSPSPSATRSPTPTPTQQPTATPAVSPTPTPTPTPHST